MRGESEVRSGQFSAIGVVQVGNGPGRNGGIGNNNSN